MKAPAELLEFSSFPMKLPILNLSLKYFSVKLISQTVASVFMFLKEMHKNILDTQSCRFKLYSKVFYFNI